MNDSWLTSNCATILVMVVFVGCTGSTATTPSSESKREEVSKSETQEPNSENEKATDSIPDGVPNDIYIADGANATEFKEAGGKKNLILDYPASDTEDFVTNYQSGMSEQGWTVVSSSKHPIGTMTNFSKGDRKCTISIGPPKNNQVKVAIVLPSD